MSRATASSIQRTHYTPAEVAKLLGVTERHIRNLCNSGEMPAVRVGRYLRIPMAKFDEFLAASA